MERDAITAVRVEQNGNGQLVRDIGYRGHDLACKEHDAATKKRHCKDVRND